jgi:hypothetical protein
MSTGPWPTFAHAPTPVALQAAENLSPEGGGGFNPRIEPAKLTSALAAEACFSGSLIANRPSARSPLGPCQLPIHCYPFFAQPIHLLLNVNRSMADLRAPPAPVPSHAAENLSSEGGGGFNPRIEPAKLASALAAEDQRGLRMLRKISRRREAGVLTPA